SLIPCVKLHPRRSSLLPYTTLFRSVTWSNWRSKVSGCNDRPVAGHEDRADRSSPARGSPRPYLPGLLLLDERAGDAHHPRLYERSEEHTSELQSRENLVCRLLLEKK